MKHFFTGLTLLLAGCSGNDDNTGGDVRPDIVYSGTAMVLLDSSRILVSGTDVALEDMLELQTGRQVDFHLSDGASVTLTGPVSGKLGTLLEMDTQIERWARMSVDLLNKSANEGHVLTVRSGVEDVIWLPFSVPVPFNGNFCVPDDTKPTLYRPGTSSTNLNFELTDSSNTIPLFIEAGTNVEIDWPEELSLKAELEFVNPAWFDKNTFKVVEIPKLDRVSLAKAGCTYHIEKIKILTR